MASKTATTNHSNNHHGANSSRHKRTSSYTLVFDNLLPDTVEIHEDVVEHLVAKHFREKKESFEEYTSTRHVTSSKRQERSQHPPKHVVLANDTNLHHGTTFEVPTFDRPPLVQIGRDASQILASGRGRLETIDSVSNVTSGSITPLSTFSSASKHRMRLSQEREMMTRLLEVSMSKDEDDNDEAASDANDDVFSYNYDDSVSGLTLDNIPLTDDHSTEKKYLQKYMQGLKEERELLKAVWKKEFEEELQRNSPPTEESASWTSNLASRCCCNLDPFYQILSWIEVFLSNMPLTIGAVGLSWVTQGTIWFKFMEENIDACVPAFFYSRQCTYPEFPGCFDCDTSNPTYLAVVSFHYFCHLVALTCCLMFLGKCFLAWKVVADELSNPATATPIGVVCITLICVAAGRFGAIGEWTVLIVSVFHVLISFWFIYMAVVVFRLQPDPSWFPCTVGIAYAAIKTWLYFPIPGFLMMVLCIIYLVCTFFTAIYRAAVNHKIAAPVCFISLSAPSITMYAMTIKAQPRPERMSELEESPEMQEWWHEIHRRAYLPVMHFMMFLSLVGFASSLQCLVARWPEFKQKAFSPAHFAFVFPLLSHTNAVQAYRSGVISYSNMPVGSPYKIILWNYWFACLIFGSILNLVFTCKYVRRLPEWTKVNETPDPLEEEPPKPEETEVHSLWWSQDNHEILKQPFVNPALLQANEAGALVRVRRGTEAYKEHGKYIRTRHVTAYGFDLVMTDDELRQERAELLDWVAKNKARPRHKTLSIPHYFKLVPGRGQNYGSIAEATESGRDSHRRTQTLGSNLHLPV